MSSESDSAAEEEEQLSPLDDPLVPLEAVLTADLLFEALAVSHGELTEYLSRPVTLARLVDMILKPEEILNDPARRLMEITANHKVHMTESELLRTPSLAQDVLCAPTAVSLQRALVSEHRLMGNVWTGLLVGESLNEDRLSFFHRFIPVVSENCPIEFKNFLKASPERIWDWFRLLSMRSMAELLRHLLIVHPEHEMIFNAEAIVAVLLSCLGAPFHCPFPFLQKISDPREFVDLHTHAVVLLKDIVQQSCETSSQNRSLFSQSLLTKQSISFLFFIIGKALADNLILVANTMESQEFPMFSDVDIASLRLPPKEEGLIVKSTVTSALDVLGLICSLILDNVFPPSSRRGVADGVVVERPTGDEPLCDPMEEDEDDMMMVLVSTESSGPKDEGLAGFEKLKETISCIAKSNDLRELIKPDVAIHDAETLKLTKEDVEVQSSEPADDETDGHIDKPHNETVLEPAHIMEAAQFLEAGENVFSTNENDHPIEKCITNPEAVFEATAVIEAAEVIIDTYSNDYHLLNSSASPSTNTSTEDDNTSRMYTYLAFGCDAQDLLLRTRRIPVEKRVVEKYAIPRMNIIAALIERYAKTIKEKNNYTPILLELLRLLKVIVRACEDPSELFTVSLLKALVTLLFDGVNNLVHIAITEVLQVILAPGFAQKFDNAAALDKEYKWTQETVKTLLHQTDLVSRAASLVHEMRVLATSSATFVEKRKSALQTAPQSFHALHLIQLILNHHKPLLTEQWLEVEEVVKQFAELLSKPLGGVVPEGFLPVAEQRLSILPLGLCATNNWEQWEKDEKEPKWDTYEIALDMLESFAETKWDSKAILLAQQSTDDAKLPDAALPPPGAGLID